MTALDAIGLILFVWRTWLHRRLSFQSLGQDENLEGGETRVDWQERGSQRRGGFHRNRTPEIADGADRGEDPVSRAVQQRGDFEIGGEGRNEPGREMQQLRNWPDSRFGSSGRGFHGGDGTGEGGGDTGSVDEQAGRVDNSTDMQRRAYQRSQSGFERDQQVYAPMPSGPPGIAIEVPYFGPSTPQFQSQYRPRAIPDIQEGQDEHHSVHPAVSRFSTVTPVSEHRGNITSIEDNNSFKGSM